MTEKDVRDLIQEDVVLKMLGPGYAKDLIACSPDCSDEIIPEHPRYAYTLGVLVPQVDTHEPNDDDDQSLGVKKTMPLEMIRQMTNRRSMTSCLAEEWRMMIRMSISMSLFPT